MMTATPSSPGVLHDSNVMLDNDNDESPSHAFACYQPGQTIIMTEKSGLTATAMVPGEEATTKKKTYDSVPCAFTHHAL